MAKTYECDRCGHVERYTDGIVGNEFEHYGRKRHKDKATRYKDRRTFETLVPEFRFNGWVDVCDVCFDEISRARNKSEKAERESILARMKAALSAQQRP